MTVACTVFLKTVFKVWMERAISVSRNAKKEKLALMHGKRTTLRQAVKSISR
jgi:hypothetical protein